MFRDPSIINFDRLTTTGMHREWAAREAQTIVLLDAPALLEQVADEIASAAPASRHAHGRHDVLTLLARASGDPGGHEHNRARLALHGFVRDCGEDGIRAWAEHNDAPTLVVGLRACAELLRAKLTV